MTITRLLPAIAAALLCTTAPVLASPVFNRVASFPVALNNQEAEATSSEIVAASEDGMMLVYSDSPAGGIGFVDITDPRAPQPAGFVALDGEPTSVTVIGGKAFVSVNTSESKANPSGTLAVVDLVSKAVEQTVDLGGQPDSVARNKAGNLLAIAIENERDEELNDGELPQLPAGFLVLVDVADGKAGEPRKVEVTGLAEVGGDDPEPEYVSINDKDEVILSLQENNHFVLVDGKAGSVLAHFSAGSVSLEGVDTKKDGALKFTGKQDDLAREPDAVSGWMRHVSPRPMRATTRAARAASRCSTATVR